MFISRPCLSSIRITDNLPLFMPADIQYKKKLYTMYTVHKLDVKFRVIDPPFSPQRPTEPNVLLLNSAVLGGAISTGFAFAFVLSLLKPLVSNQRMLGEISGLPVFGSVPLVQSPAQKRDALKQTLVFSIIAFSLFIALASLSFKYALGMA